MDYSVSDAEREVRLLQKEMMEEIRKWCEENVVSKNPSIAADIHRTCREMISRRYKVPVEWVSLSRPRWDGDTFRFDGFTIKP